MANKFMQWLVENTEPNITGAQLAKDLGVKPSLITHWKKGKRQPGIGKLKKLMKITGLKVEDFII